MTGQIEFAAAIEQQLEAFDKLSRDFYTVATVERHDESVTPFVRQLGWRPGPSDDCLIDADRVFIKHGYLPPFELVDHLKSEGVEGVWSVVFRLKPAASPLVSCCLMPPCTQLCSSGLALDHPSMLPLILAQNSGSIISEASSTVRANCLLDKTLTVGSENRGEGLFDY